MSPINPTVAAAGIQAGAQVGGGILSMIGQRKREERAMKNQQKLMGLQMRNQMTLNEQGQKLQMDTWEGTNYPAQMKMLEEAGLNPSLLYGKGGSGGVTGSQGGGSAASGNAPAPQQMPNMDIGNALRTATEVMLSKAQTRKLNAEANVIESYGTKQAEAGIAKTIAETQNEVTKNKLIQIEADIAEIERANRDYRIKAEIASIVQETKNLLTQNELTEAQFDDIVKETKYKAINAHLTGALIQSDTKLNQTQAQALVTGLVQKWTELGLTERKLNQEDQRIMIETFNAEIKAEYPGLGQAAGAVVKKAYDFLEELTLLIPGKGQLVKADKVGN